MKPTMKCTVLLAGGSARSGEPARLNETAIQRQPDGTGQRAGHQNGQLLWPVRTALSGEQTSPGGAMELADILGREESIRRIKKGIEKLSK